MAKGFWLPAAARTAAAAKVVLDAAVAAASAIAGCVADPRAV